MFFRKDVGRYEPLRACGHYSGVLRMHDGHPERVKQGLRGTGSPEGPRPPSATAGLPGRGVGSPRAAGRARRAFSLVEIMIVIVIIGLLAGVVTINVRHYLTKAKQNAARQGIATIVQALDSYWAVYNRYPTNEEGLSVLVKATDKMPEPLLKNEPIDPWGRPFVYNSPGPNGPYQVVCLGPDGREGGEGVITSDDLGKP